MPTKVVKNKNTSPWIDAEIIHNSNIKKRLYCVAKHSNNPMIGICIKNTVID